MEESDFRTTEVRQLLSLCRGLGLVGVDELVRKQRLLAGLCRLVGAVSGLGAMLNDEFSIAGDLTIVRIDPLDRPSPSDKPLNSRANSVDPKLADAARSNPARWTEGDLLRGFIRSNIPTTESGLPSGSGSEALLPKNPLLNQVIQEAARRMLEPTALSRAEAVDDEAWYRSDFFRQFRAPQGLDDCILSVVPLPGLQPFIAIICLSGPLGGSVEDPRKGVLEPFFNARQRRVIEIAHAELRWIYYPHEQIENEIAAAESSIQNLQLRGAERLSPRLQRVLQSLLRGASEKEVAGELGLSKHTIHEYVRSIYRSLGVASRSELMAQLIERDA